MSEVEWRVKAQGVGGGGGCTINLSGRWVVEEVIHPVEEVITLL